MNILTRILAAPDDPKLQIAPIKTALTPDTIKNNVINWVSAVAGVIAFIYIIYGGFMYLTAAGNAEQAKKGGQTLVNAALGLVIIAISYGLTTWIISVLKS